MTVQTDKRPAAIRVVIPFVFRHWLQQPGRAAVVAGGLLGATAADLFMPIFSGRLVDALTLGTSDAAARHAAFAAFGGIVALGLMSMILRLTGLQAIVELTLKMMADCRRRLPSRAALFDRLACQQLRRLDRAQDHARHVGARSAQRHDAGRAVAVMVMLVGSTILLGCTGRSWRIIAVGSVIYIALTVACRLAMSRLRQGLPMPGTPSSVARWRTR